MRRRRPYGNRPPRRGDLKKLVTEFTAGIDYHLPAELRAEKAAEIGASLRQAVTTLQAKKNISRREAITQIASLTATRAPASSDRSRVGNLVSGFKKGVGTARDLGSGGVQVIKGATGYGFQENPDIKRVGKGLKRMFRSFPG